MKYYELAGLALETSSLSSFNSELNQEPTRTL